MRFSSPLFRGWWAPGAILVVTGAGGYPWVAHAYQRVWREQQAGSPTENQSARLAGIPDPRWDDIV